MGPHEPLSRRGFARAAALGALPLPVLTERALAQMSYPGEAPPDAVFLNANENPLGPCAEALEAMSRALRSGGRYQFGETLRLARTAAQMEGVPAECVQSYAGSSDPLHRVVLAFCGPGRAFVTADPGYEAGERAAAFVQAPVHRVPLTRDYAHDVEAMLRTAGKEAGVFYICNPNNPTGTLTPREAIEHLVRSKPSGSVVLIDEAYIHFCQAPSCMEMVRSGRDVFVLRTFSKIYGMAGLRAGLAFARPDLLDRIRPYGTGFLPVTGMVGAIASLEAKGLVAERREYVRRIREDLMAWLRAKRIDFVPSVSNKIMIRTARPGREVAAAMRERKVMIGRSWPSWPNHVRVTLGTPEEMEKFKAAFLQVISS
ncbi:MAG: aminotransferase [Bryobacteraceae bacterium]|nr:MAG: aminotransferase [Bryobacteraceae bacterium]